MNEQYSHVMLKEQYYRAGIAKFRFATLLSAFVGFGKFNKKHNIKCIEVILHRN